MGCAFQQIWMPMTRDGSSGPSRHHSSFEGPEGLGQWSEVVPLWAAIALSPFAAGLCRAHLSAFKK